MKKKMAKAERKAWLSMQDDNFKKIDELTEKLSHGGRRKGAGPKEGSKRVPYHSTTVRVPNPILKKIQKQIADFKNKVK